MICILKYPSPPSDLSQPLPPAISLEGWIIATDLPDARRQAHAAGEQRLASLLYATEFEPPSGKHFVGNFIMLVS